LLDDASILAEVVYKMMK